MTLNGSSVKAATEVAQTLARKSPWALIAVGGLAVVGLVSYGVPKLFAEQGTPHAPPVPAHPGDSPVTRDELSRATAELSSNFSKGIDQVRGDVAAERVARERSAEETRRLLDAINQRVIDLAGRK